VLVLKTTRLKEKLDKLKEEMGKLAAYEKQMLASPDCYAIEKSQAEYIRGHSADAVRLAGSQDYATKMGRVEIYSVEIKSRPGGRLAG
jgi:hypothetical protein